MIRKSFTLVRVGPVTTRSPRAEKNPYPSLSASIQSIVASEIGEEQVAFLFKIFGGVAFHDQDQITPVPFQQKNIRVLFSQFDHCILNPLKFIVIILFGAIAQLDLQDHNQIMPGAQVEPEHLPLLDHICGRNGTHHQFK